MTLHGVRIKPQGDAPKVVVEGTAAPHADVVVENQSQAPFSPVGSTDAFTHGKAGADGAFSFEVPAAREGDHLRVQSGTSALRTRLHNVEAIDGRRPVVRQQGIRLIADTHDSGDGFRFGNVSRNDVIGEPAQQFILTNLRTQLVTTLTLDDDGRLPADARVPGKRGDRYTVATSDGTHTVDKGCGLLLAPPEDPRAEPRAALMSGTVAMAPLVGPLFVGGPDARSIKQGELGDCWLVAACDAIAATHPQRIRDIIRDNHDGTFTVTFQRWDREHSTYVADEVTVTNQVYMKGGKPLYGQSLVGDTWFPILEKAYAQWKGGYDGARSGYPFEAFEAILGDAGRHFDFDVTRAESLWSQLQKRGAAGEAMVTWTRVDTAELRFANTGLVGDHAFSVLGTAMRDGAQIVRVRNPWGSNTWGPKPNPLGIVTDKDVLEVPLAVFTTYFGGVGAAPCARSASITEP